MYCLLCLGLLPCIAPHIEAVSPHQYGRRARVFLHRFVHAILEVLLEWRILDDRNHQFLVIAKVSAEFVVVNALQSEIFQKKPQFSRRRWHFRIKIVDKRRKRLTLIISK